MAEKATKSWHIQAQQQSICSNFQTNCKCVFMQLKNIDTTLNYIIDVAVETDASLKTFQLTLKVQQSL